MTIENHTEVIQRHHFHFPGVTLNLGSGPGTYFWKSGPFPHITMTLDCCRILSYYRTTTSCLSVVPFFIFT